MRFGAGFTLFRNQSEPRVYWDPIDMNMAADENSQIAGCLNTGMPPDGFELKIEITDTCQARCTFCHQNFGARKSGQSMPDEAVFSWIRWAAVNGISRIRFTGGEPTLHSGLPDFCRAASDSGLHVTLNTNGLGHFTRMERLLPWIDMVKLSIPTCDPHGLENMTGVQNAMNRKLDTLGLAVQAGMPVDVLTVMVPENMGHVRHFYDLLKPYPGVTWTPLRVEPSPQSPRPISREQIQQLAREFLWVGSSPDYPYVRLGLATPFCAVDPIEIGAAVFSGRGEDCGPFQSLSVDVHSCLMRCYSRREPIVASGDSRNVSLIDICQAALVEDPLPRRCQECLYLDRCRGGCRCRLSLEKRNGEFCDYLMPPEV